MSKKVLPYSLSSMALLALSGYSWAFGLDLPLDQKIYPSTFCKPEKGSEAYCLNHSEYGFVSNECGRGVTVVCPMIRDKMTSDHPVNRLIVSYETPETTYCSFKSTRMLIQPGIETHFDECDFSLSPSSYGRTIGSNYPSYLHCADWKMPSTEPYSVADWQSHGAYTLTCTLPKGGKLGHYFINEPE